MKKFNISALKAFVRRLSHDESHVENHLIVDNMQPDDRLFNAYSRPKNGAFEAQNMDSGCD